MRKKNGTGCTDRPSYTNEKLSEVSEHATPHVTILLSATSSRPAKDLKMRSVSGLPKNAPDMLMYLQILGLPPLKASANGIHGGENAV